MNLTNIVVAVVIVALVAGALWKIRRDKRKGIPCTGCSCCPAAGNCEHSSD